MKTAMDQILGWARDRDFEALVGHLSRGRVHGKPGLPTAELSRLEKGIRKALSQDQVFRLGRDLLKRKEPIARRFGVVLVTEGWPKFSEVESLVQKAADDEDWIVREFAAEAFGSLLQKDFESFSKKFETWTRSGSTNVKRAIALAVKFDARSGDAKRWKTYLTLVEPLLGEEDEYIRKNLGPFAIGDGLLARFPAQTLKACAKWARHKNENVRWNTAMVFTAAAARSHTIEGTDLLMTLSQDPIPSVARAAERALRNLEKVPKSPSKGAKK